jgi:hypothetical protein
MEDLSQAMALVPYYNSVHAIIRGTVVFFQFSNRTEITSNVHAATVCLMKMKIIKNLTPTLQHRKNKTEFYSCLFRI